MFIFDSRTSAVCVTAIKFIDVGWGRGQFNVLPKYCKLLLANSVEDLLNLLSIFLLVLKTD